MNSSTLLITRLIITSLFVLMACENSSQEMERVETPKMKSDRDVDMTESQVLAEVQIFRLKTSNEIKANFRKLAAIQETINTSDERLRKNYEEKLEVLDNNNREMKRSIDNFTDSGREKWTIFREEFSDSMDELANCLDNFFDVTGIESINI